MGHKLSKTKLAEKDAMKRFKMDFQKVENIIKEAKNSEEEMDFSEASSLYMRALKVVYSFMDETNLPDDIREDLSNLVFDMIRKREHLIEYKKMYDTTQTSYREDRRRHRAEDGKEETDASTSEDEVYERRKTVKTMAAAYHKNIEEQEKRHLLELNKKQRQRLKCQILNKQVEEDQERSTSETENEESDSYQEEEMHYTDIDEVRMAMADQKEKNNIERENFKTDSEYVLAVTEQIVKESNMNGVTAEQLSPIIYKIMWTKNMEGQKKVQERKWNDLKVEKLVREISANYERELQNMSESQEKNKKLNDTEKEMKEIYEALYKKLEKPGREKKDAITFNSIIGLEAVKRALDTGIQVPLQRPELVASGAIKHYEGLLLFGPPGTGKSFIAKALANEAKNCSFIQVDRADLVSKWQGQSEKIVNTLFKIARENKPCIIFVDEIEGLLEDRDGGGGSTNGGKVVTVLLTAMQNLARDQVFVLGASNYPWKLDKAFYRRFSQIVYVPLPNFGQRVKIFKANIYKDDITSRKQISHADIEQLALLTENYSGSHITRVVEAALAIRYQRVAKVKYFKKSSKGEDHYQPCTKEEHGAKKMSVKQVPNLVMPPLLMEDLEMALFEIKNNVEPAYLKKLVQWGNKNSNMNNEHQK